MIAIVSQGICAMLMTVTPFANLLTYIGLMLNVLRRAVGGIAVHLSPASGLAEAARRELRLSADPGVFRRDGHLDHHPRDSELRPIVSGVAALTVAAGALVYHFRIKKGATHES